MRHFLLLCLVSWQICMLEGLEKSHAFSSTEPNKQDRWGLPLYSSVAHLPQQRQLTQMVGHGAQVSNAASEGGTSDTLFGHVNEG